MFRVFALGTAHCLGDRFSGMAVIDGVLPVGGIDGIAVSRSPFDAQG
jgi:hypothetical protein